MAELRPLWAKYWQRPLDESGYRMADGRLLRAAADQCDLLEDLNKAFFTLNVGKEETCGSPSIGPGCLTRP